MAYLATDCPDKEAHVQYKPHLSLLASLDGRTRGRGVHKQLAATRGGLYQEALDVEFELSGGRGEPERCKD